MLYSSMIAVFHQTFQSFYHHGNGEHASTVESRDMDLLDPFHPW